MSETETKGTARRKSKPKPQVHEVAPLDMVHTAVHGIRQQLRSGEAVALPGILQQLLPANPNDGDKAKIDSWRSFVVWAEWTGNEWALVVFQDGKPKA